MKTAIYIEDGNVQLVITPESAFEKAALASFNKDGTEFKFWRGSFYDCQGGWTRHTQMYWNGGFNRDDKSDDSLILQMATKVGKT